jgi:hypothetical protein
MRERLFDLLSALHVRRKVAPPSAASSAASLG